MLRVVLDTNVLLVAIPLGSRLRWIYDAFLAEKFMLCVTTEILAEYAEIIGQRSNALIGEDVLSALVVLPQVALITPHYRFNLLRDPRRRQVRGLRHRRTRRPAGDARPRF